MIGKLPLNNLTWDEKGMRIMPLGLKFSTCEKPNAMEPTVGDDSFTTQFMARSLMIVCFSPL